MIIDNRGVSIGNKGLRVLLLGLILFRHALPVTAAVTIRAYENSKITAAYTTFPLSSQHKTTLACCNRLLVANCVAKTQYCARDKCRRVRACMHRQTHHIQVIRRFVPRVGIRVRADESADANRLIT